MSQKYAASSRNHLRSSRGGSWLKKKIRHIRDSRRKQKQLKQLVIIIAAVLIAFFLGFYFFGPGFTAAGD